MAVVSSPAVEFQFQVVNIWKTERPRSLGGSPTGDEDIRLIDAKPTYLEGRRGIALTYQDVAGHTVTYVIVPGGR